MKTVLKLLLDSILELFVLSGCRTSTIYNATYHSFEVIKGTSEDEIYRDIKNAGTSLGWMITKVKPGLAQGKLNIRENTAIVDIPYSTKSYSINFKSGSDSLKYDPSKNTIHKQYNQWISRLDKSIQVELNRLAD